MNCNDIFDAAPQETCTPSSIDCAAWASPAPGPKGHVDYPSLREALPAGGIPPETDPGTTLIVKARRQD